MFRGDRWGWNDLFHPGEGHEIEDSYIRPLVKSSKAVKGYVGEADAEAFVCRRTEEQLKAKGHKGALRWIRKLAKATNEHPRRPWQAHVAVRTGDYWSLVPIHVLLQPLVEADDLCPS